MPDLIASLAWYPAARPGWERLWAGVRANLGYGPETLDWPEDFHGHWRRPDLLLSMTCALPMQKGLAPLVRVVGSPVWDVPGLPPGHYASELVCRADDERALADLAAAGMAINDRDSQSGFGALVDRGLRGPMIETGSHAASMQAVAEGRAHLAAIDAVTWALAPHPALTSRGRTRPTAACPFITALPDRVPALRAALGSAIAAQSPKDRAITRLAGLTDLPAGSYASLPLGRHCNHHVFPA